MRCVESSLAGRGLARPSEASRSPREERAAPAAARRGQCNAARPTSALMQYEVTLTIAPEPLGTNRAFEAPALGEVFNATINDLLLAIPWSRGDTAPGRCLTKEVAENDQEGVGEQIRNYVPRRHRNQ